MHVCVPVCVYTHRCVHPQSSSKDTCSSLGLGLPVIESDFIFNLRTSVKTLFPNEVTVSDTDGSDLNRSFFERGAYNATHHSHVHVNYCLCPIERATYNYVKYKPP